MTRKQMAKLPKINLYIGQHTKFQVYYKNSVRNIRLPLEPKHFTDDGRGLPWACGIARAVEACADLFDHPVLYVHAIGSTVYIVAKVDKNGLPLLAIRYRHRGGWLVDLYDKSRTDSTKRKELLAALKTQPRLTLERARYEAKAGAHSPGAASGHRDPDAPRGDLNKKNLSGNHRRAVNAGFWPQGLKAA